MLDRFPLVDRFLMPAAAALPPEQQAVRTWWSLSKAPRRDLFVPENNSQQPKPSGKFNSFVSAIGLKPKKHTPSPQSIPPVVTIQTRPPSKSVSSTQTRVDSLEPPTPVDLLRNKHQSLLTLSDMDPFASRHVIAVPVPNSPSDFNHLSANSNPSVTDFVQKKPDTSNRVSYASSSSTSHIDTASTRVTSDFWRLHKKRSVGSLRVKRDPEPLVRENSVSPNMGSSSTLVDVCRRSQPDLAVTRPKMRARGMTDGGATQKAGFFVQGGPPSRRLSHTSPSSNTFTSSPLIMRTSQGRQISPKVIIRQASVSRLQTPPSAPPTQRLPPPPPIQTENLSVNKHSGAAYQRPESTSSPSVSFSTASSPGGAFASGTQVHGRRLSPRHEPDDLVGRDLKESKSAPDSPRTLKKARSHQTLSRRNIHTSPSATPKTPPEAVRKQRNFAHPRLPIPPIPLPVRPSSASNSTNFPSLPEFGNQTPTSDSRKGRVASSSGRRRIFSGSSKLSGSKQTSNKEDDTLSMFSLRSERDSQPVPNKPWISTTKTRPSSSFWDEVSVPGSPVRPPSEYTPQVIMSREELARLDESVDNTPERSIRSRGFSVLSTSTMASDFNKDNDFLPVGLSPPPPSRPSSKQRQIRMSSISFSSKQPSILSRPSSPPSPSVLSIADDHHAGSVQTMSPTVSRGRASSSSSQALTMTSLPPPPRSRRPTLISEPDLREPTPPHIPLHGRLMMRKPSFLDIGDSDQETESEIDGQVTESFLDLARESFDTARREA